MIGFFDYTTILTYLSLVSAMLGIVFSLSGAGHPFIGSFFLLFCGLCDAFDGKVARTKSNRTEREKNYGIQIDSLSDIIAFGVLPGCIGAAMWRRLTLSGGNIIREDYNVLVYTIVALYALAAMIRLAYFNVTEMERQKEETGVRKTYTGLPVTSAALIFPSILLIHYILERDITPIYLAVMLITAFAFLAKFRIPKPGLRGILIMVGIGLAECAVLVFFLYLRSGPL